MRRNYEWLTIKNPRKKNGDMGDLECNCCGCHTGTYVTIGHVRICKGCLDDGVKSINKVILDNNP